MKTKGKILAVCMITASAILLQGCREKGIPADMQKTFDRYISYWNNGQFDDIENVVSPGFELLESPGFEPRQGIDYFKKYISNTRVTYPDFRLVVNETVYEKDKIAYIWTVTGTHLGTGDINPTGRTINGKGMSVLHFDGGKIINEWRSNNNLQWLMQLGFTIVPPVQETVSQPE